MTCYPLRTYHAHALWCGLVPEFPAPLRAVLVLYPAPNPRSRVGSGDETSTVIESTIFTHNAIQQGTVLMILTYKNAKICRNKQVILNLADPVSEGVVMIKFY